VPDSWPTRCGVLLRVYAKFVSGQEETANRRMEILRSEVKAGSGEGCRRTPSRHHAIRVRLFGSVARGEDRPDSDIDLLVDFT
jgi:predicted nucleotidyltransferase